MNSWSRSDIQEWQNAHLQAFIKHAYEHTKYYRNLFDSLGITPEVIRTPEDLKRIPVITKDIVNAHYNDLIPDDLSKMRYRHSASGGTTGKPMKYLCSEDVWGYVTAAKIYYWRKMGYQYGDSQHGSHLSSSQHIELYTTPLHPPQPYTYFRSYYPRR